MCSTLSQTPAWLSDVQVLYGSERCAGDIHFGSHLRYCWLYVSGASLLVSALNNLRLVRCIAREVPAVWHNCHAEREHLQMCWHASELHDLNVVKTRV